MTLIFNPPKLFGGFFVEQSLYGFRGKKYSYSVRSEESAYNGRFLAWLRMSDDEKATLQVNWLKSC